MEVEEPHSAVEVDAIEDIEAEEEEDINDTIDKEKSAFAAEEEDEDEGALFSSTIRDMLHKGASVVLALLLAAYLLAAFIIDFHRAIAIFICTVLCIAWNIWAYWAKQNEEAVAAKEDSLIKFFQKVDTDQKYGLAFGSFLVAIMAIMMAVTVRDGRNMVSLFGLIVFIGLTWLFSWKPKKVKFRPVIGGIFIQFIFGYVVIRTSWGFGAIEFLADVFTTLLGYTVAGSSFVFDWLTDGSLFGTPFQLVNGDAFTLGPPFFFNVLPSVIFFSALMSVGYYIRVIPWLVKKVGYGLAIMLGTSASESLSAAGNIFIGQTEAPLLVKPFMPGMTESELHAIMTGGFATIAGSVFGIYISFGIDANALLAASVMSAPAALAVSKLAFPEVEDSPTAMGKKGAYEIPPSDDANVVHAATNGAVVGTQLMLNIAGNLVAFLAIIAMLDALLGYLGDRVDVTMSFNIVCEYLFYPFAWLMGVDPEDCSEVAILIGLKIFANEFVAYEKLAFTFKGQISDRSYYIASFALCGFSNFGSVGIQLGGLTPLAPNQGKKLAKLVLSAMVAGNTACFMTACIAGIFYEGG